MLFSNSWTKRSARAFCRRSTTPPLPETREEALSLAEDSLAAIHAARRAEERQRLQDRAATADAEERRKIYESIEKLF